MARKSTATATVAPTTCGAWLAVNPESPAAAGRSSACGRLPRHNGECRTTLTLSAGRKIARASVKSPRKVTGAAKQREFAAKLASDVEAGTISAGDALAKFAKFTTRSVKRSTVKTARPVGTVIEDDSAEPSVVVA